MAPKPADLLKAAQDARWAAEEGVSQEPSSELMVFLNGLRPVTDYRVLDALDRIVWDGTALGEVVALGGTVPGPPPKPKLPPRSRKRKGPQSLLDAIEAKEEFTWDPPSKPKDDDEF